ncbi:MAG: DUF4105 domain-containing protein [Terricaulis sp.]
MRTRPQFALAAFALLGAASVASCISGPARADRTWDTYLARTAHVEMDASRFSVAPVSDWSYDSERTVSEAYGAASFEISQLRQVWFMLEPQPGSRIAAHTLLLFEFADDRLLGLTIEARREAGEDYSAVRGAFNTFELSYVWGTARDFLTRRAVLLDHEVFIYPIAIGDEQKRNLLTRLLERTAELEQHPRYYNTLFSNCTNELAKAAGFSWAPAFILTGRSDQYLFRRRIIPGADFSVARQHADVTAFVRALNAAPAQDFDAALLAELRRRSGD